MACDEDELVRLMDIQEGAGLPSCDVVDDDEEGAMDIEPLPHVEACSFLVKRNIHSLGVADLSVGTDDHPLAWSDLLVLLVMNEY